MSIALTIILIGAGALLVGVGIGYYLRLIIALGKRRSIEIDIKQMMVGAKEEAQKITDEAKKAAEAKLAELKEEEKRKSMNSRILNDASSKRTSSWTAASSK